VQDQLETRGEAPPARDVLGLAEAARVCGVPLSLIRRHRDAGDLPGAYRDARGVWHVPVPDLRALGLLPPAPAAAIREPAPDHPEERAEAPALSTEQEEIQKLRTQVAVLRERLAAVQLIAKERGDRIADLRVIVRMLPRGNEGQDSKPPVMWLPDGTQDAATGPSGPPAALSPPAPPVTPHAGAGPAQAAPTAATPKRTSSHPVHIPGWRETFDDIPPGRHGKRTGGHRRPSGWSRLLWRGEE